MEGCPHRCSYSSPLTKGPPGGHPGLPCKKSIAIKERSMSAVRASALFTFIRPAPPLRGNTGRYITIKKPRMQKIKGSSSDIGDMDPEMAVDIALKTPVAEGDPAAAGRRGNSRGRLAG